MFVSELKYENYRNLKNGGFCPDKETNVIYGDNAQGKTNLIEAIWLFTGQKSFRGNKDSEQINNQKPDTNAVLSMNFYSSGRKQTAKITIGKKKAVLLNEVLQPSVTSLSDSFAAVVFSPAEMQLINDGPGIRRKFLDNAISILRPKYAKALNVYNRAVAQRNSILKDVQYHSELTFMLDAFEANIAKSGAYIIATRQQYLERIMEYLPIIYSDMTGNRENIEAHYKFSGGNADDISAKTLTRLLYDSRKDDIANLATSVGPHRDDIEFLINGLSARTYGSQGQRRSAVLALKLSEAEILKRHTGERPVTLLDDVMSELDRVRQDYILNHIKGWQVFITCCEPTAIENLKSGSCFRVENGEIYPQN